jgi:hypothetical protein
MGLGAGMAVASSVLISLNLIPTLVFTFPRFFANAIQNDFLVFYNWCAAKMGRKRSPSQSASRISLLGIEVCKQNSLTPSSFAISFFLCWLIVSLRIFISISLLR